MDVHKRVILKIINLMVLGQRLGMIKVTIKGNLKMDCMKGKANIIIQKYCTTDNSKKIYLTVSE